MLKLWNKAKDVQFYLLDAAPAPVEPTADAKPPLTTTQRVVPSAPQLLPLATLCEDPANPRTEFPEAELDDLADDIRQHGILQPIVVHPADKHGQYRIHFGAKRWRPPQRAGLTEVPVVVRDTPTDPYPRVAENQKRTGLTPLDMAHFIKGRVDAGASNAEIAKRLGMNLTTVAHHLALLQLPPELDQALKSGRCTSPRTRVSLQRFNSDVVVMLVGVFWRYPRSQPCRERMTRDDAGSRRRAAARRLAGAATEHLTRSARSSHSPLPPPIATTRQLADIAMSSATATVLLDLAGRDVARGVQGVIVAAGRPLAAVGCKLLGACGWSRPFALTEELPFMESKILSLATAALLSLGGHAAQAACAPGATQGTVSFGSYDTGVVNRCLADGSWLDERFADEGPWGSEQDFFRHVSQVSSSLVSSRRLDGRDHARLIVAALRSEVGRRLQVKLIAFNDFHGNIKAFEGSSSNPGVARFATRIQALKAANPLHAVVSAGDMIGASPLTSALFKDEPTIEAMNRIGIDFNAVGNHEFDEGKDELLRMQRGGNHPTDPYSGMGLPQDLRDGQFRGASFGFLAANVIDTQTADSLLPAYGSKDFLGNKVAFIGMTLEATPTIVSPSGVAGLQFKDEADTVNALIPRLKERGIHSVVVLIHEGGFASGGINGCTGVSGPIVDVVSRLDPEVDLVVSGHTHLAYNCLLPKRDGTPVRVTSAGQYGRNLSDIDLTIDTRSRDVVAVSAVNLVTGVDTAEDASLGALVAHYDRLSSEPKGRIIGRITSTLSRSANAAGESALGDVIADAQLDATDDAGTGQAVVAFMNPGGIRADLVFNAPSGNVSYGDAFTVQPFGNSLVTLSLTGAQLRTLLETQFAGCNGQTARRILQVSTGFSYGYTEGAACGLRIGNIMLKGLLVDPTTSYRVTVNSFLADGGDGFAVLGAGTQRLGGAVDVDAFEAFLKARPEGVGPGPQNRIVKLD